MSPVSGRPLDGIRVLDLSRVLAGPLATQSLAELGAEVIKIERPGTGDESRAMEPVLPGGESAYFFAVNRSKRSVAVDLRTESGREVLLGLVRHADIVVENFLPGTLDRLGLGREALTAANDQVILVSNTGFGQTGPDSLRKGYDTIFQALSGVMHLTGHPDTPPAKVGVPVADLTSSLWIVIAALVGLRDRDRTGRGGHWDVAMMDVQASLLSIGAARLFAHDEDVKRAGTDHPGRVPSSAFHCADDRWVFISASDQHWPGLCRALGLSEQQVDSWATNAARVADRHTVTAVLQTAIGTRPHDDVVRALTDVGVPAGLVRSPREALAAPQARHRDTVQSFTHGVEGSFPAISTPLRRTGDPAPPMTAPPRLGQDTEDVLTRVLGLDDAQVRALLDSGAVSGLDVSAR